MVMSDSWSVDKKPSPQALSNQEMRQLIPFQSLDLLAVGRSQASRLSRNLGLAQDGVQGLDEAGHSQQAVPSMAAGMSSCPAAYSTQSSVESAHLDKIWESDISKVDLPQYVRAHNTSLSFPEKLMMMLIHIEKVFVESGKRRETSPIGWTMGGRAFVIRERNELVNSWLPMFFRHGKFQSFTRKLYRWGFRQVHHPQEVMQDAREILFASPHFQRDHRELMTQMKSVTAAGVRRQQKQQSQKPSHLDEPQSKKDTIEVPLLDLQSPRAMMALPRISSLSLHPNSAALAASSSPSYLPPTPPSILHPFVQQLLINQRSQQSDILRRSLQQLQFQQQFGLPTASLAGLSPGSQYLTILPSPERNPIQSLLLSLDRTGDRNSNANVPLEERQVLEAIEQCLRGNLPSQSPASP